MTFSSGFISALSQVSSTRPNRAEGAVVKARRVSTDFYEIRRIIHCHPSNFDEMDGFQRNLFLKPISSICPYQVLFLRLELKLNDFFYD